MWVLEIEPGSFGREVSAKPSLQAPHCELNKDFVVNFRAYFYRGKPNCAFNISNSTTWTSQINN